MVKLSPRDLFVALVALGVWGAAPVLAADAGDFYKGKTVRIIIGSGEGSGVDILGRIAARHLGKHIAGNPTISLPGGFTSDGLPIGIQLAAWKLEEPKLIRAGAAFQSRTDFHTRHPAL